MGFTRGGKDVIKPHPHQGKVKPFEPGDPKVPLDRKAISTLESGKPYQTQIQSGTSGRGLVVQDVHAPTNVVWERILDYNHYAQMVPNTLDSKNYNIIHHKNGQQTIFTRMKVGFSLIKLTFYVKHEYIPALSSLTWTLDYTRKSDFDDSCGYWYVMAHPDNPKEWSRVYYSVEVSMFDWVPKFVVQFMSTKALTDATGWVKKFSEMEYAKMKKTDTTKESKGTEQTTTTTTGDKRKRRGWFMNRRKRQQERDDDDDESTCASSDEEEEECSVTPAEDKTTKKKTKPAANSDATTKPTGGYAQYYALVASVIVLSLYNVHTYFSAS
eukprot:CAMPEP_0116839380 /NCGR_PEP_ID=MMETSP0418-20121206/9735_1 /TAXON_ID=1158023 /ORGANISM="Astrosyne radiata, Strain 13vi08-1A" /LENGTH=325 /DNA_ID=CAMNT_0004469485 /DNA_START=94 /DNA_END=1071 /DNA_ORIENTATION=+